MERRNRYRNPVKMATVFRVAFFGIVFALIGGGFVFIRNEHVQTGDKIRNLEQEIAGLDQERQLWELRLAGALDRLELSRRLKWANSSLTPIDPSRVLKIESSPPITLEQEIVVNQ